METTGTTLCCAEVFVYVVVRDATSGDFLEGVMVGFRVSEHDSDLFKILQQLV